MSHTEIFFDALRQFRQRECSLIADIVHYLAEVDSRGVFRDLGLSSSAGAAQRRIVAARCSFVAADGGRCFDTVCLEYDHVVPFSHGGGADVENIRVCRRAHNQLFAERTFGKEFMAKKRGDNVG